MSCSPTPTPSTYSRKERAVPIGRDCFPGLSPATMCAPPTPLPFLYRLRTPFLALARSLSWELWSSDFDSGPGNARAFYTLNQPSSSLIPRNEYQVGRAELDWKEYPPLRPSTHYHPALPFRTSGSKVLGFHLRKYSIKF